MDVEGAAGSGTLEEFVEIVTLRYLNRLNLPIMLLNQDGFYDDLLKFFARVAREGQHLSVITYAAMLYTALEAADILSKEGIDIEVVDLRSVAPLDREAIAATVKKTNKVIILHEHSRTGGLAGEISAIINEEAFDDLDGPILRITAPDTPVPFSPPQEEFFLPKVSDIVREARRLHAY